jgi:DHA1 family tetracycline resistance protein-like MFS transporter
VDDTIEPVRQVVGRKPAMGFIFAAVLMDTVAMGMIMPVLPPLLKSLAGQGDGGGAQIGGVFAAVWALMQLVVAPILGNLSDRFGRRPVLLLSMLGLGLDYVVMALAPSVGWLLVGRVISGATSASGSTAMAYVADVSTPENRARNFGLIQAAFRAGILLGPAIGGALGAFSPRAPFWIAAAMALANCLYGFFVLPESLAADRRRPFHWARANPVGAVRLLFSHQGLLGLAALLFLLYFASSSFNSIFQFFTHYRFGWGPAGNGLFLMALGAMGLFSEGVLAGVLAKRIGERAAVITGIAFFAVGFVCLALAPTPLLFLVATGVTLIGGASTPNLMSMLSGRVAGDEQGQLQGALTILAGASSLVGPVVFSSLFAWAVGPGASLHLPGLPFLTGAALMAASLGLAVAFARPKAAALAS